MSLILRAQEHILALDNGEKRFKQEVAALTKAFTLSLPSPEAMQLKEEIAFFQIVKIHLAKLRQVGESAAHAPSTSVVKHMVDSAIGSKGVVDILEAAGIEKPDISIFSEEFLENICKLKQKNVPLALLKNLLNAELKQVKKKNLIQGQKLSEKLQEAIYKYQNNLLSAVDVIEHCMVIALALRKEEDKRQALNLTEDEKAFYDTLI